jgi:monoamine oxidase
MDTASSSRPAVIVIGAGAAGLMAARELSAAGIAAILLEAAGVPGGRIRTLHGNGFSRPVEEGAEFIHGDLPLTLQLLKAGGIPYIPSGGEMITVEKGIVRKNGIFSQHWEELMKKMSELKKDLPAGQFLRQFFSGRQYAGLRDSVKRFAGGYDLADLRTASTLFLYREWSEEDGGQHRIEGGYGRLIDFLLEECLAAGCRVHCSAAVREIEWEKGRVNVSTAGGTVFTGSKVIVTASLGVMQLPAAADSPAAIKFSPAIPAQLEAFQKMGYGSIIKILMEFSDPFWNRLKKKIGFIVSDEEVPTWWTQYPDGFPLLTGWLPAHTAAALGCSSEEELTGRCLSSLAGIFAVDPALLKAKLRAVKVLDWSAEPFVLGGYSFDTVDSAAARELLCQSVQDTLYFAGEALHTGTAPGTVEAALESGRETARKIAAQS